MPQHNEIQHTYIYLYTLSNTNIFPVWTIHVTYLNDVTYIDDCYISAMGDAYLDDCYISGPTFIKPDQLDPWIKDQIKITLLPTISHLLLPNFVSCGRACPSHMTQNLVTVGAKLWTADRFLVDPWSMDYADPVW